MCCALILVGFARKNDAFVICGENYRPAMKKLPPGQRRSFFYPLSLPPLFLSRSSIRYVSPPTAIQHCFIKRPLYLYSCDGLARGWPRSPSADRCPGSAQTYSLAARINDAQHSIDVLPSSFLPQFRILGEEVVPIAKTLL